MTTLNAASLWGIAALVTTHIVACGTLMGIDDDGVLRTGSGGSQGGSSNPSSGNPASGADTAGSGNSAKGGAATSGAGGTGGEHAVEPLLLDYRVAVGSEHVCAVRNNGAVYCFGSNTLGQLGNGQPPAQFPSQDWSRVVDNTNRPYSADGLRAGALSTCGTGLGEVRCWGSNEQGQLGRPFNPPHIEARAVLVPISLSPVLAGSEPPELFSGASHVCAKDYDSGDTWCWGSNDYGEIDPSRTQIRLLPSLLNFEPLLHPLALGVQFSVGLFDRAGTVYCWGRDDFGQCGNQEPQATCHDGTKCVRQPSPVPGAGPAHAVFAGARHACAISSGTVRCWGNNDAGQAAPDVPCTSSPCSVPPTQVSGVAGASKLALGEQHTCALVEQRVVCWGKYDVLGRALIEGGVIPTDTHKAPGEVLRFDDTPLESAIDLAAYDSYTCAMTEPDDVWCWGYDVMPSTYVSRAGQKKWEP